MNINKLISYVSMILIVMLFVGVVSATEADSGDILETNDENTIVEQSSVIDTSGSQETDDVSEVLSAGDSEVLGAGEGTYTELHELIQGNATININKDYKYDPDVDKKYSWNGYEDAQDYKYGIPIWDVKAGFNNVKTITINGNGHTIDGNHMARIFNASHLGQLTVSGVNLVINNLTFINGCVESADTSTSRGGAIVVGPYKVTLTLNNCTFEDNMAKNTNMGDPVGNESNYGTAWGGAVYINGISGTDYSTLYVNNCTFRNNTANYGGAIASSSTNAVGKVYIKDSLFDDNHADSHPYNYSNGQYYFNGKWYSHGWGGAVYAYYTEVLNSTFVNNRGGNRSGFGGAISTYKGKFEDSKFINNTCYQGGAIADGHLAHGTSAVDTDSSKYEIDNCTFDNNKAQLSGGAVLTRNLGAYFFASYGDMVVNNSNFTNNYGGIYGGGAIMSSCPFIYNSNFINNSAYNYGGAVTAGYAELGNVTFTNNSAAHSGALFCIEPYFIENTEVTFNDNYIIPRVLYDNGFTTNDTEVQDGKVIVTSDLSFYVSGNRLWNLDPAWTKWIPLNGTEYLPLMYIYKDSPAMNKGVGYYGFDYEVDLYGHAIEYDHKDVKGGYGQVSPGGAEGIVTDDLSYLINYIDGRELKEYIKILYYLCNLNESFMDGAFRNKEAGELALEFPIKELCFSDLSNPINDLMKNITDLYDSGFRVPNNYYKLSDTLKDHMAHSNVMVPDNADDILKDDKTVIIYHPFLYIVPFYHTHYLSYYQTNITIEKITLNKTVMLGEDVEFKVTVTNGGNYSVYDIFVQDYQYDTDGLIYKGYKNDTGKWVYDEQTRKYNLVDVEHYVSVNPLNNQVVEEDVVGALKPRTSKSIIFVFTTNKTGVFNNTATNGYSNATNNTTVIAPDLKIEKITLNKTVYLGNQTMFKLRVTNTGAFDLSNIIVEEYEYDDGLVLADFKADWPWFGNINTKKFVYLDTLKPGESSEFIVIFNTTKIGNFTNYAVATHNKTGNRTANNTTEVIFMINITKIWDDADNQDGIRPKNVTVELLADGEKVDEIVLSENNNWTAYFKELHGYNEEGNLINYTVKELKVDNYTTINLGNITALNITINNNSFEIKNNHTPLLTNVTVNKKWDDRDNQDGIRPSSIVVNLLADGHVIDQATLSLTDDSNWNYTFVNLPVNKKGKKINYTVEEVDVDGYEALITNSTLYNWTVTNVHVPELVNVTVQKVWSDADNQDGFRPVSVEVQLLANGTVINSTVLDAS
ncbi:MAG: Cna B-type domain-containing protein, partial [Methanobrevibacter sp.]|uniref:Cna B-type domain-containing protein n=1 Tax=Methanobrevibacter sp. TaxID=66852 RepID=UPI0025F1C088